MMEESPYALMERIVKFVRNSIFTFLKHYQYFTTTPALLMLPFSALVLLPRPLFSSYEIPISLLHDGRFSPSSSSSKFTLFLNQKFSQSFFFSVFILPFTLSSLLMAKASIIQALNHHKPSPPPPPFPSCLTLYNPLLKTHIYNVILIIFIHTAAIFLHFLTPFSSFRAFGFFQTISQTVGRLVFYALLTNVTVVCNFALVVAGMENCNGYAAIYKARTLLRKGRNSMALLLLALLTNLGLASLKALFCFRLVRPNHLVERLGLSRALEGILIAYLYSLVIVLDTIACCLLLRSCEFDFSTEHSSGFRYCDQIELV
ncbi:Transmembrane protein [Trema orientale]|uniref:Transmembrane protein n=1 Tax=Trema orientale TaxID=63057 RepID=A0A2P5FEX1_TREOI|nr:Transmembrane protein [Trema orientale]